MIIVSQDKMTIVNFDNVKQIYITTDEDVSEFEIRYETIDSLYETLGSYKTEERAEEVLKEIVDKYRQWNKDANNAVTIIPKVYEMPKE